MTNLSIIEVNMDPLEIFDAIGLNITQLRRESGLKRSELAERVGITPARLRAIEDGRHLNVSLYTLVNLASELEVSLSDLVETIARPGGQWSSDNDLTLQPLVVFELLADAGPPTS